MFQKFAILLDSEVWDGGLKTEKERKDEDDNRKGIIVILDIKINFMAFLVTFDQLIGVKVHFKAFIFQSLGTKWHILKDGVSNPFL